MRRFDIDPIPDSKKSGAFRRPTCPKGTHAARPTYERPVRFTVTLRPGISAVVRDFAAARGISPTAAVEQLLRLGEKALSDAQKALRTTRE